MPTLENMAGNNDALSRSALRRGVRLVSLPLGYAGQRAAGLGRRMRGVSAESVNEQMLERTADQMFRVLGELKGGAMKAGQAMSLFESALPDEIAAPYREKLSMLRDSAPPMPTSRVHAVLTQELGTDWRQHFSRFEPRPAAAASIGQVHRGVWSDGRRVAVKVQYPGADEALRTDLKQLSRMASIAGPVAGGMDLQAIAQEIAARVDEELDYDLESAAQQQFADGFSGDCEFVVPQVLARTSRVMVSEWLDGTPLSEIAEWPDAERNAAGLKYVRFLFAGPSRVGLLHADPHPGNFTVLADGRLGVMDFGLVARLPDGLPYEIGQTLRVAMSGDVSSMVEALRREGILTRDIDPDLLVSYLAPFAEPAAVPEFRFDRSWMQNIVRQAWDDIPASWEVGRAFNLPDEYVLMHRVWTGGIAVLCQLGIRAAFRDVLEEFLPGFAPSPGAEAP